MQVIAHRGASKHAPENTLAAFRKAAGLRSDMVELDVHLSSDGLLVVMHDTALDRTTNGTGALWKRTAEELGSLDAGSWFSPTFGAEGVPALREVFGALLPSIGVNVEVKAAGDGDARGPSELGAALLRELDAYAFGRDIIVSSFGYHLLEVIHALRRSLALAFLYATTQDPELLAARMRSGTIAAIHPLHELVSADLVLHAHSHGLAVNAWTVDSPERMRQLAGIGIDGIITNVPDLARLVLTGA